MILATLVYLLSAEVAPRPMPPADRRIIANAVGDQLLDGVSARYRWPLENPDGAVYCGFVNAKNSYGAYTGFQPFMVLGAHANGPRGNGRYIVSQVVLSTQDRSDTNYGIAERMCAEAGFDLSILPPE